MAERDVSAKTESERSEEKPVVQEDLSERGPVDPRMLEIGRAGEHGEIATPANQESTAGIVSRG